MKELFSANEFYGMTGTSRETLRHYVDKGLILPAHVSEKGYAYYGEQELLQMMILRYYRSFELSVTEMKGFLWEETVQQQVEELDLALERLDRQIAALQQKRARLVSRRRQVYDSAARCGQAFIGEVPSPDFIPKPMYILNILETWDRLGKGAIPVFHTLAARFPRSHISLMANCADFLAKRPMPVRLGYGTVGLGNIEGLDPDLFRVIPVHRSLVTRIRVADPLLLSPEDLRPLYDRVEAEGCEVVDGVFGHLLSMERQGDRFYYYITMRVHIR